MKHLTLTVQRCYIDTMQRNSHACHQLALISERMLSSHKRSTSVQCQDKHSHVSVADHSFSLIFNAQHYYCSSMESNLRPAKDQNETATLSANRHLTDYFSFEWKMWLVFLLTGAEKCITIFHIPRIFKFLWFLFYPKDEGTTLWHSLSFVPEILQSHCSIWSMARPTVSHSFQNTATGAR